MYAPGRTVFVGHREVFVRVLGPEDAPPLVLVHGWAYDSEVTWFNVAPVLAERYRVYMIDQRNHGKSDWTRGRYSIEDVADEVAGAITALGLGPVPVFGYSMGGMVAQALAKRHPMLVTKLVLGGTAARPIAVRRGLAKVVFWLARGVARISMIEGARISYEFMRRVGGVAPQHSRWLWQELLDRDPTLYYEGGFAIWRFDSRSWVGKLRQPALVIIPTRDALVRPADQYELASLLDGAEVVELIGSGHESIITRGGEMAKLALSFLDAP